MPGKLLAFESIRNELKKLSFRGLLHAKYSDIGINKFIARFIYFYPTIGVRVIMAVHFIMFEVRR